MWPASRQRPGSPDEQTGANHDPRRGRQRMVDNGADGPGIPAGNAPRPAPPRRCQVIQSGAGCRPTVSAVLKRQCGKRSFGIVQQHDVRLNPQILYGFVYRPA